MVLIHYKQLLQLDQRCRYEYTIIVTTISRVYGGGRGSGTV